LLSNRGIADAAVAAWDSDEAIMPIPAEAPRAEIERRIALGRPTHLIDEAGRHRLPNGVGVAPDTAAVISTSGTTGTPKLVELTRSGMQVMGRGYCAAVDANADDRWLACMPLYHVASLAIVARAYVSGLPFVVHDRFDLDRVAMSYEVDGATMISLVPTVLLRLLDAGAPLDRFRCLIIGGAVLPPGLRARAETVGARVVDAYGLSETWGGCAINGVPNDGVELRLGPEDEIEVRGAPVMRGYRFDPDATAAVTTPDGWFRTGDVGRLEPGSGRSAETDQRLRVVDRLKDLVITGGVNVSPTEVEDVLHQHAQVRDVCVIGAPDDEWGERVVAVVVAHDASAPPTLTELRAFARVQLTASKLPRELRLVEEIPRSASGKALRRHL
jgi:O-succinylbenzoic acid--CoA ligase